MSAYKPIEPEEAKLLWGMGVQLFATHRLVRSASKCMMEQEWRDGWVEDLDSVFFVEEGDD